jgi:hypothetical protein
MRCEGRGSGRDPENDQATVDKWKDQATKFLQGKGSKFTPANSIALRDAWAVRTLAALGTQ